MFSRASSALVIALSLTAAAVGTGCAGQSGDGVDAVEGDATSAAAHDFEGTIGTLKVLLRLDVQGTKATGSYFYADKTGNGDSLVLDGTVSGGKLSLTEKVNGAGNATGTFDGKLSASGISGTWKSPTGATLPLSLSPIAAKKVVTRKLKATAPKSNAEYARECSLEAEVIEVFGIDAKVEKAISDALKVDALDKAPDGTCDSDIRYVAQSIAFDASGFLTIHVGTEWDGGAHPENGSDYFNFQLSTGANLGPKDLFAAGSEPKMKTLIEAQINASKDLSADEKKESIDEFENHWDGDTKLENIAMGFGEKGLTVDMGNNYPHVVLALAPVVEIPWSDIKPLLQPGSVIAPIVH